MASRSIRMENAYVVGQTYSSNYPITNALQSVINGTGNTTISDGFITNYLLRVKLLYSTYIGGSKTDIAYAVCGSK